MTTKFLTYLYKQSHRSNKYVPQKILLNTIAKNNITNKKDCIGNATNQMKLIQRNKRTFRREKFPNSKLINVTSHIMHARSSPY